MKNKIIYCITGLLVLSALALPKNCEAEESEQEPKTIMLSGTVYFDDYKKGPLIVEVGKDRRVYKGVTLTKPGSFSIELPENLGQVTINAVNIEVDEDVEIKKGPPDPKISVRGRYRNNPVVVGSKNIGGINIKIARRGQLLSEKHKGRLVEISGNVRFDGYESGVIVISCSSAEKPDFPDVAATTISNPGKYILNVPVDIGPVYLWARNIKHGRKDQGNLKSFKGSTEPSGQLGSPIYVGSRNIEADDIVISYQPLLMDKYASETVSISGKIIAKDYQGEKIYINISTKKQGRADINLIELNSPGQYSVKVPKNIGDIFIKADTGKASSGKRGDYEMPLSVATEDIDGVDIELR